MKLMEYLNHENAKDFNTLFVERETGEIFDLIKINNNAAMLQNIDDETFAVCLLSDFDDLFIKDEEFREQLYGKYKMVS